MAKKLCRFWIYPLFIFIEKTTSNGAEQENSRLKTLLVRSMLFLDMLDAVKWICILVPN